MVTIQALDVWLVQQGYSRHRLRLDVHLKQIPDRATTRTVIRVPRQRDLRVFNDLSVHNPEVSGLLRWFSYSSNLGVRCESVKSVSKVLPLLFELISCIRWLDSHCCWGTWAFSLPGISTMANHFVTAALFVVPALLVSLQI